MSRTSLALSLLPLAVQGIQVTFNQSQALFETFDTYLSYNIDTGSLYNGFDFKDVNLITLVKNLVSLGPSQIRIGGTAADDTIFTGKGGQRGDCTIDISKGPRVCIDETYWDEINQFMEITGAEFVYDFNLKERSSTGAWNSSNTEKLLAYTAKKGYKLAAWQLGNEVELYDQKTLPLTGKQVAADYRSLQSLLETKYPTVNFPIVGPDACCEDDAGSFISAFSGGVQDVVAAITIHDYPILPNSDGSCEPSRFTDIEMFKTLGTFIDSYNGFIRKGVGNGPVPPVILGEVASTYNGGCDGLSNRFISGFVWIYTLGAVGEHQIAQLNRQDIAGWSFENRGSNYPLMGATGWVSTKLSGFPTPHPDYFVALLWKQLVGSIVLSSSVESSDVFDAHVWCTTSRNGGFRNAPIVSYLNVGSQSVEVTFPDVLPNVPRIQYFLTSTSKAADANPSTLTRDEIYLNGVRLSVDARGRLEHPMHGQRIIGANTNSVTVPPYSYGFIVFEQTLDACKARVM